MLVEGASWLAMFEGPSWLAMFAGSSWLALPLGFLSAVCWATRGRIHAQESGRRIDDAGAEAIELLDEAQRAARSLLDEAAQQAEAIVRDAWSEARTITEEAQTAALGVQPQSSGGSCWDHLPLDILTHLVDVMHGSAWRSAAILAQVSTGWRSPVAEWRSDLQAFCWCESVGEVWRPYGVTDKEVTLLGRSCSGLTHLDLSPCHQTSDAAVVSVIERCSRLRHLSLCHSSAPKMSNAVLLSLAKHCANLTSLDLSHCRCFDETGLMAVADGLPRLRSLTLASCQGVWNETYAPPSVTASFVSSLVRQCPQLTRLDLSQCCALTDQTLQLLSVSCPHLRTLTLGGTMLSDEGTIPIVTCCRSLTNLDLYECSITEKTLHAIANSCPSLVALDVGSPLDTAMYDEVIFEAILALTRSSRVKSRTPLSSPDLT